VFLPKIDEHWLNLYLTHLFTFFSFFAILAYYGNKKDYNFSKINLAIIVFLYSLLIVIINNAISAYYNDNYFVFSEIDPVTYNKLAKSFNEKNSLEEAFDSLSLIFDFEDFGAVFVIAMVYNIAESNLIVNLLYVILGVFTALGMYNISAFFMNKKYAFLCTLSYSISSFVLWFHSSGLKESFLMFLVVQAMSHFYNYRKKSNIKSFIYSSFFLISILFFRPAITFLMLASMSLGILFTQKLNAFKVISISIIIVVFVIALPLIIKQHERYLAGGDVDRMIEIKEITGMVKGSLSFTYAVNILSALVGPLPTFSHVIKPSISFCSSGLLFRVVIAFSFISGVYFIIRKKVFAMLPILIFPILEILSLVFILEALELRKSLPHFPFMFILSFWFLYVIDNKKVFTLNQKKILKHFNNITLVFFIILILYWNFRFE
jgi:hypothetical protein